MNRSRWIVTGISALSVATMLVACADGMRAVDPKTGQVKLAAKTTPTETPKASETDAVQYEQTLTQTFAAQRYSDVVTQKNNFLLTDFLAAEAEIVKTMTLATESVQATGPHAHAQTAPKQIKPTPYSLLIRVMLKGSQTVHEFKIDSFDYTSSDLTAPQQEVNFDPMTERNLTVTARTKSDAKELYVFVYRGEPNQIQQSVGLVFERAPNKGQAGEQATYTLKYSSNNGSVLSVTEALTRGAQNPSQYDDPMKHVQSHVAGGLRPATGDAKTAQAADSNAAAKPSAESSTSGKKDEVKYDDPMKHVPSSQTNGAKPQPAVKPGAGTSAQGQQNEIKYDDPMKHVPSQKTGSAAAKGTAASVKNPPPIDPNHIPPAGQVFAPVGADQRAATTAGNQGAAQKQEEQTVESRFLGNFILGWKEALDTYNPFAPVISYFQDKPEEVVPPTAAQKGATPPVWND